MVRTWKTSRNTKRQGRCLHATIRPRNLRAGIFRGGRRPIDLYWRIKNGIAGTPMPAASGQLSDDDLWHVVDYVRSLQYDKLSQPGHVPDFQRERN